MFHEDESKRPESKVPLFALTFKQDDQSLVYLITHNQSFNDVKSSTTIIILATTKTKSYI